LDSSNPHFIRCIKPNIEKKPKLFDNNLVLVQLRYTGLLETVKIRKAGYPFRTSQFAFLQRFFLFSFYLFIYFSISKFFRFYFLDNKLTLRAVMEMDDQQTKDECLLFLQAMLLNPHWYQLGKTRVFLK